MNRAVYVDGKRVALQPAALLGQGGEAEVYDLCDGRVLKWWKPPQHPDFDGQPAAQAAAARRIAEHPAKLRALPGNLPPAVVAPCGFALAGKRTPEVAGYLMPKVSGEPLHALGEPRWRREHPLDGDDVLATLLALHDALAGLHRAGVVVGDCNDLNVLVEMGPPTAPTGRATESLARSTRVHLIDVDSYQYGGFTCSMFSERFVDPRLCDAAGVLVRPHDVDSDWFAFAVMAFRSLLLVGPWGGVHQPADPARRCPPAARALRRLSVYAADVVYPRAARALATLPDELTATFRAIFERDQRGVFPRTALERVRFRRCTACGDEHARVRCPACATALPAPPTIVHGRLRWHAIAPADVHFATYEVTRTTPVWLDGGALYRRGPLGPERIGSVLAAQTRAWVGPRLGVGFYRAGGYAVGFVFRPDRGLLDDRVALPKIRGQLVDAHAVIADDRAWVFVTTVERGRLVTTCVVVGADASVLAVDELADAPWLAGVDGACAAGPYLFVPTDHGVVRIEATAGALAQTRTFAETAPLVGAGDRLALSPGGLDARRAHDAIRLQLT